MNTSTSTAAAIHWKDMPAGTLVRLDADFRTGSGVVYKQGTIGKKGIDYDCGAMVTMPDNVVIAIPFQSVTAHIPVSIVVQPLGG